MATPHDVLPSALSAPPPEDDPVIVPRRRPGRTAAAVAALLVVGLLLRSVARNPAFQWDVVGSYLTSTAIVHGLLLTLWLTAAVMVLGFAIGTVLAVALLSGNPVLSGLSRGYVWIFRATPVLVQLLFWFNIGALYPTLSLGLPYGPQLFSLHTVDLLGPTVTAVIGLTLHEAAFAAEVVRAGSSPSTRASWRPPSRSACAGSGCCAASSSRRRCAPSFPPPATC
ncbi:hypothetical protein GCM10025734_13010 [Kitasatospora paranensis]